MDALDPSALQVVGGWLLLAALFVLREVASGALKEAGKQLWDGVRRRHQERTERATERGLPRRRIPAPPDRAGGRRCSNCAPRRLDG